MKKKMSKFVTTMSIGGALCVAIPLVTSCSSDDDLHIVTRGNGSVFASYGDNFNVTFNQEIIDALNDNASFSAFKKQYADQLLYNFYKKIADSRKVQSYKDNWTTWTNDVDDDYKDKVQDAKDKHGSTWEFYFQNETLDPVGGTEDAWKYNQMCSKIRSDLKTKILEQNYIAYSSNGTYDVNNTLSSYTKEIFFNNPNEWRKINFYAYNNPNYNPNSSLDDIYATIQKQAFEMWTQKAHPFSVSMCLWKYAAPAQGIFSIYSSKIQPPSGTNDDPTVGYAYPAFPECDGTTVSANSKFYYAIKKLFLGANTKYGLVDYSGFSNIPNTTSYTDDSATQIIINAADFSGLDAVFGGGTVNLWSQYSGNTAQVSDKILKYDINDLLADANKETSTDILRNFFFRSNDQRLFDTSGNLTALGTALAACENKIDLGAIYQSKGKPGVLANGESSDDFHSLIFANNSPLFFDYYGNDTTEGGVQWVVPALRLYDGDKPLPYLLIRDEINDGGVHIIGLNGASYYDNGTERQGYLGNPASEDNDQTDPYSQGRENILLKAQYLYESTYTSTSIDIQSKIKDFLQDDDSLSNVIIAMAKNQVRRANNEQEIIFNDEGLLDGIDANKFYQLISTGYDYFLTQSTISAIDSENKRLFNTKFGNVTNSVLSRSESLAKMTSTNYTNGMATPYPFAFIQANVTDRTKTVGYVSSLSSYDINRIMAWQKGSLYTNTLANDVWDKYEITFNEAQQSRAAYEVITTDLTSGITPNIQTSGMGARSEHIFNEWKKENALSTAIYATLNSFGASNSFSNNAKIKAMKAYISGDNGIVSDFDLFNGYATLKDSNLKSAFISQYISSQIVGSSSPMSMLEAMGSITSVDDYANFLEVAFKDNMSRSYSDIDFSSTMCDYLQILDAIQYLVKDDYANLIYHLSNNVIRYGDEADLVWVSKENISCVPTYETDQASIADEISASFNFKSNYYGQYSNTYFNNGGGDNDTPSNFSTNDAYYKFAPIPNGSGWTQAMGFAGLVTSSSTTSPITTNISNQIFKNAYYTKRDSTGQTSGGWYKYGDLDTLKKKIELCSGLKDVTDLANNLAEANSDPDFTNNVKSIVNRSFYSDGDPEVAAGTAKVGEPISVPVLRARLAGTDQMYKDINWGLETYCNDHTELVNSMFKRFGDSTSAAEVCDGDDVQNVVHTIKVSDDAASNDFARVMVIQLNSNDVSSYNNLISALGGKNSDEAKILLNMIAVQYALTSSIKTQALQDVVNVIFRKDKLTVFDRRFNDQLGQSWVKDWKPSN